MMKFDIMVLPLEVLVVVVVDHLEVEGQVGVVQHAAAARVSAAPLVVTPEVVPEYF